MGIPFETEPGFWECPYQLFESGGPVEIKTAAGVDAFQAIVQALDHISVELAAKGRKLRWFDDEPGMTGFARNIPISFGQGLIHHLESLISAETDRWANEAAAGMKQRPYYMKDTNS